MDSSMVCASIRDLQHCTLGLFETRHCLVVVMVVSGSSLAVMAIVFVVVVVIVVPCSSLMRVTMDRDTPQTYVQDSAGEKTI